MSASIPKTRVNKAQILREAAVLFQQKGFQATSMRELATRVGLEVSSLYSHIDSKQAILEQICFENADQFFNGLNHIEKRESKPAQQIQDILGFHIDTAISDPSSITVFNDEWKHLQEPALTRFIQMRKQYEGRILAILTRGMESDQFKKSNPQIMLLTILSILRGIHHWAKPGKSNQAAEIKKVISSFMLEGLLK